MKNKNFLMVVFVSMMLTMIFVSSAVVAQTDSLAVWENVADGSLICNWLETNNADWTADNDSGIWKYNCTGNAYNVSTNNTILGDRWYQTFEVLTSDPTHGISVIQTVNTTAPVTRFYAMEYYISHAGANPEAYIVYHEDGTNYYWDTDKDTWDHNVSNATDYSGNNEIDFYSGETFARVKAQWNWADNDTDDFNCTARFKIWLINGDEPREWMIDDAFSMYGSTTEQNYYPGIGANHTNIGSGTTTFRRLFFWNLSYDYDTECHELADKVGYIGVPQYDAETMFDTIDSFAGEDFYNYTIAFKDVVNEWDLTSFYNESYSADKNGCQNDTIYIFSLLTTGWEDFFEEYFEYEDFWEFFDGYFPNNILMLYIYNPTDGTIEEGEEMVWNDTCRVRFDFDGDGYDSTDYTFYVDGTEMLYGFHGWEQVIPDSPDYWYGYGDVVQQDDDGEWGRVFRDADYPAYNFFLNWDLISDETDAGECVNISIGFYDNETVDPMCFWQDWNETNDTQPNTASDNKTWKEDTWNTTTNWGILRIEGSSLDFDDPEQDDTPNYSETTGNLLDNVIPILVAVVAVIMIIGLLFTVGITVETLMTVLVLVVLMIITLQIALGV